jgi:lysine 2,3-aminomutase
MSFKEKRHQPEQKATLKSELSHEKPHSIGISAHAKKILHLILEENPKLQKILKTSGSYKEFLEALEEWALSIIGENQDALDYFHEKAAGREAFGKLRWKDFAAVRILDYIEHTGEKLTDLNLRGEVITNNPFGPLWLAVQYGTGGAHPNYYTDMLYLFRQLKGTLPHYIPDEERVKEWMDRHPSGLDDRVTKQRKKNKDRIIRTFIRKMDAGDIQDKRYSFEPGASFDEKYRKMNEWWNERLFHLRFAIRDAGLLNEMLDHTLDEEAMEILHRAEEAGIPIFVNPYYLSLVIVKAPDMPVGSDLPIRDYIFTSEELVDEFGEIVAWEKEDIVEPGKPNAAGWLLPSHSNIHRRYPEVSILIPDTVGRACGGLCVSCQRMYDFQSGNLNFNLDKLKPKGSWWDRMGHLMDYFEKDSQLRDILITGGDALMSTDKSLKRLLDAVYEMAERKKEANLNRNDGEKFAEMLRVRLGTRLPVYLPQRITPELTGVLSEFREKAQKIGVKQFVIQTHFESAMEITPEVKEGVAKLLSTGWIVTNQQVFTASASRRGHTAKLRKVLNDIGVLTYYTFSVKGYMENYHNFAPNARAMQEQLEEKVIGEVPESMIDEIKTLPSKAPEMVKLLKEMRSKAGKPFLAMDRNVLNLPGVGKSLAFRVIGITRHGRRILLFDHDHTRIHSPIIDEMGKVVIIESKPVAELIRQYKSMGEDVSEYESLFGYSIGENEKRMPIYHYPEYPFKITPKMTNLEIGH